MPEQEREGERGSGKERGEYVDLGVVELLGEAYQTLLTGSGSVGVSGLLGGDVSLVLLPSVLNHLMFSLRNL